MNDAIEMSARLSAQQFLLEILYTNAFAKDPAGFDRLMDELQRLTRVASRPAEPATMDEMIEMQARIATNLQRFQSSVQSRIASGRAV